MDALTDLEILEDMLKEIVWAPNKAFGLMMKKEAEKFAQRFERYSTPEDEAKLEQALAYAWEASGSLAQKEHFKFNMLTCWATYERAIRVRVRNSEQNSPISI